MDHSQIPKKAAQSPWKGYLDAQHMLNEACHNHDATVNVTNSALH